MKRNKEIRKKQERRLHYNRVAEDSPENIFSWYFLIVNEPREMERIKQRMYEALKPHEQINFDKGNIDNSHGLKYALFCIKSSVCNLDFSQVYSGKIIKDRRLYSRESSVSLLSVLEQEEITPIFPRRHELPPQEKSSSNDNPSSDYTM